jgi:hypothetical protein
MLRLPPGGAAARRAAKLEGLAHVRRGQSVRVAVPSIVCGPPPEREISIRCQRWEAARCVDDAEKQIVRIEWDSIEGHLQGFRRSPDFKPFLEATQPFYKDIEEMTHYDVTARG